jgi:hypothetical protein
MTSRDTKRRRSGVFSLGEDKHIHGELKMRGKATSLYLHDKEFFTTHNVPGRCIRGVLHDLTHVTLVDCVCPPIPGSFSRGDDGYHFANVFPHYVVHGEEHLDPQAEVIDEISFLIDDAVRLFDDFDAFGSLLFDAQPYVDQIVKARITDRLIETSEDARLIYFTGKTNVCTADTVYGKVSVERRPGFDFGGSRGAYIQNKIVITIKFSTPLAFDQAVSRVSVLIEFLGLLVGRPQNLLALGIRLRVATEKPVALEVAWSHAPKRDKAKESKKPGSFDVLLDAVRDTEQFSGVLRRWLERQEAWHGARWRFFQVFEKQRQYDPDRLIGAANMFDILPAPAVPDNVSLSPEITQARAQSRAMFKLLPPGPERDSILSALGRLGKPALKHKVRYRAQKLVEIGEEWFPDLYTVTDEAVNCRNYYVHGTTSSFDYDRNFDLVTFFTDTLEFVFAVSDLIEAGWDFRAWVTHGTTMSHPFASYRVNYRLRLGRLRETVTKGC